MEGLYKIEHEREIKEEKRCFNSLGQLKNSFPHEGQDEPFTEKGTLSISESYKVFPKHAIATTAPNFYVRKPKEYEILDEKELRPFKIFNSQNEQSLLNKTKTYITQKRKILEQMERPKPKVDLKIFTRIFDGSSPSEKENAMVTEFLKMKRESMQNFSIYDRPKKVAVSEFMAEEKTEEEIREINARMRRKLNHKKLISLHRYT